MNGLSNFRLKSSNEKSNIKQNNIAIFNRDKLFKVKLNEIRSICLDQTSSELWQLIKRDELEYVLSGKNKMERNILTQLFIIATLFYYEYLSA